MGEIKLVAIDLAKRSFQVHAVDSLGKAVLRKSLSREALIKFAVQVPSCIFVMEACSGCHFWARKFLELGHEVKLIAPQFVKPFVKSNKNDRNDAEAIAEAAVRPSMRFVQIKDVFHQNLQSLHRIRSRVIQAQVSLVNEIYGLMHEYGVIMPKVKTQFRQELALLASSDDVRLTDMMKVAVNELYEELLGVDQRLERITRELYRIGQENETCQRLLKIPGVGKLTVTAILATVVNAHQFKSGREMSAWLGLVPRQHSTGGRDVLLGISKRGDPYLRQLLIHGARTVVYHVEKKNDRLSQWIKGKEKTRGRNKTIVAVANKNARIIWALMTSGKEYQMAA